MKPTWEEVEDLRKAWFAAQDAAADFDEAISDEFFGPSQAAYMAYMTALHTYLGLPCVMFGEAVA